jgi:ankyrin repeat protein
MEPGALTLGNGIISLDAEKVDLALDVDHVKLVKPTRFPDDPGKQWIVIEYQEGESSRTVAFTEAGSDRDTWPLHQALLATWLTGSPPPDAIPPAEDMAAAIETLRTSRLESTAGDGREVPANVWSLVFTPGLEKSLIDAYMAKDPDDHYRFTLIKVLGRRPWSRSGNDTKMMVRTCMMKALRDDSFDWVKVEALQALMRLGDDEETQREIEALMESESGTGVRFAMTTLASRTSKVSPLFVAAKNGWHDVVARLITDGADLEWRAGPPAEGWTPLMIACAENQSATVKHLLEAGANANAENAMGRTPVMFAANYGLTEIVEMLARAGADLNARSNDELKRPAIIAASLNGHAETASALIKLGADPDMAEANGFTALLNVAGEDGSADVIKALLDGGADVNAGSPAGTPLSVAGAAGVVEKVELFLDRGADVNGTYSFSGMDGISALMIASSVGQVDVVKALVARGADVNARNSLGSTALVLARMNGKDEVVVVLREAGARE